MYYFYHSTDRKWITETLSDEPRVKQEADGRIKTWNLVLQVPYWTCFLLFPWPFSWMPFPLLDTVTYPSPCSLGLCFLPLSSSSGFFSFPLQWVHQTYAFPSKVGLLKYLNLFFFLSHFSRGITYLRPFILSSSLWYVCSSPFFLELSHLTLYHAAGHILVSVVKLSLKLVGILWVIQRITWCTCSRQLRENSMKHSRKCYRGKETQNNIS